MSTDTLAREDASVSEDDSLKEIVSDTRQFVTFQTGNEVFAVDMGLVQEIIRVPEVVRVPLAPPTLEGLANLRGKVLPIISLRRLFNLERQENDDGTRVVVVDVGQACGFVVDRVSNVVGVEPGQIEAASSINGTVDAALLSGIIKDVGGHAMIMVLDFLKLIEREYSNLGVGSKKNAVADRDFALSGGQNEVAGDELQLVSFHVAGQEYAVTIDDVQEIVQVPDTIIHVPGAKAHVLGVMTQRSRLLPLVSLRRMFGLAEQALDEKSRIVVLVLGSESVGLAVDGVNEVLRVAKSDVNAMPALLEREGNLADISEICRLGDGKRLVSIISVRNLFNRSEIEEALGAAKGLERDEEAQTAEQEETMDEDEQVVVFRLDKEEFGVPIGSVEEIVRVPDELTRVPKAAANLEGVINLRGTVLPVLDLRPRLGMERVPRTDRQRIMVFMISGLRTGFIVDQVLEVLMIPKAAIEKSPQLSSEQGKLLSRMANLEKQKRIVQLLDPAHLVEGLELAQLAAAATEEVRDQAADS